MVRIYNVLIYFQILNLFIYISNIIYIFLIIKLIKFSYKYLILMNIKSSLFYNLIFTILNNCMDAY
ncbi:hypothetical protein H8356DRAFT_42972 [Neocallimastix lanati (nom. inval.)]|nr:hypothetical protein H8356DRAFT_42972 [Neocallimastix sp. JGI-2020a]